MAESVRNDFSRTVSLWLGVGLIAWNVVKPVRGSAIAPVDQPV
jgi:hypothetical protein